MNNKTNDILLINVENLSFTVPIKIDNSRFLVNTFHKEHDGSLYGILIITSSQEKELMFNFFRDVAFKDTDERANKAIEIIKNYIRSTLKIDDNKKDGVNVGGSMDLTLSMGMEIEKTDGKGNVIEKKHVDISKKIN